MSAPLSRRNFLASLSALGATLSFPALASASQVNRSWAALLRSPWYFDVEEYGTIVEPEGKEPSIRRDVYDVEVGFIKSPEHLIDEIESHDELRSHFCGLASNHRDELVDQIERHEDLAIQLTGTGDRAPTASERFGAEASRIPSRQLRAMKDLAQALEDEDNGWQDWIVAEGLEGLPKFLTILDGWLDDTLDWSQMEFWPSGWSSQGKALAFFEQMDGDVVDALGVQIIMGEHPGSSYYAAELRAPIDHANAEAQRLKLPFRFRAAS
jgi:hypothetical protein